MKAISRVGITALLLSLMSLTPVIAENMPIRTLAQGAFSGIQAPRREVIKDQKRWEELWDQHAALIKEGEAKPQVDFTKEMVIVVTMGRQSSGGYKIEVTQVEPVREQLRIIVRRTSPPPGAMTIQALTAPFHFAAVPRNDLEPKFIDGKVPEKK
jgi:hypothetical protein